MTARRVAISRSRPIASDTRASRTAFPDHDPVPAGLPAWSFAGIRLSAPRPTGHLNRKCACKEEETHNQLARKESGAAANAASTIPAVVHDVLRSPGAPLDHGMRSFMEPRFGRDFSDVRIHADEHAARSAAAVNALAYTVGSHVVLGDSVSPGSAEALPLLAHELVHVEQQRGTSGAAPAHIAEAGSPQEMEADRISAQVMAGRASTATAAGDGLMRMPVVNAGSGTTEELKAEIQRLRDEQKTAPADEQDAYTRRIAQLETYLAERGNSTLADCPFALQFNGSSLRVSGDVAAEYPAVSGEPGDKGKFDYSPEKQRMAGGPIPEGEYWINPAQLKMLGMGEHIRFTKTDFVPWGDYRITIHPFDSTYTFGRGGFFIHGGAVPGSIGCIDLTGSMDAFAHQIERYKASMCKAKLRVTYPKTVPDPTMRLPPDSQLA